MGVKIGTSSTTQGTRKKTASRTVLLKVLWGLFTKTNQKSKTPFVKTQTKKTKRRYEMS